MNKIYQIYSKPGHVVVNRFKLWDLIANLSSSGGNTFATAIVAIEDNVTEEEDHQPWLLDSGATHHLTYGAKNLDYEASYDGTRGVTIGNGIELTIEHRGSSYLVLDDHKLVLNNILHIFKL